MKYIIKNNQLGLYFKKQVLKKVLPVGEYSYLKKSIKVVIVDQKEAIERFDIDVRTLQNKEILNTTTIQIKANEIAIHYVDDLFYEVLTSGTYSFFNNSYNHTFKIINTMNVFVPEDFDFSIFELPKFINQNSRCNFVQKHIIDEGFNGILKVNGKYEKILTPGKYYFFSYVNKVEVKLIDLRNQVLQVSGQELLTKDKVTLRMNFALTFKIIDSLKAATLFDKYDDQIYLLMQLALREFVSTKTLDELLAEKHEIGKVILETVKNKENDFGAIFIEAGLKDIILPGDIREILNTILIAEKQALANVITRREETASTRSLLNTAKLMEENETLYKLKELEYLERICEKVGNISLSSSGGIIEQLNELLKSTKH